MKIYALGFVLLLLLGIPQRLNAQSREAIHWPIDTKLDTVMHWLSGKTKGQDLKYLQQQCEWLFAPSGYFIVELPNKTEKWIAVPQFLSQLNRSSGVRYQMKSVKVIHFQDVKKDKNGKYSSYASIYFDVQHFENHQPQSSSVSKVTIPLSQTPPASDYWQIYELKITEVPNTLSATPKP
ncbi:hypothetical protein [Siphonobacter curvatus]|uniref:Uncharacterized protein n=1 Tax=Siphonobacter curvatus TaxID=2094562 RepID=A0A2S7IHK7_9BACT|nr:hypothetical protein [Siphonobacter curvatus]PQA55474.1 hypothetical protein C5O19_18810 [Siphonobacter curvatus]